MPKLPVILDSYSAPLYSILSAKSYEVDDTQYFIVPSAFVGGGVVINVL